MKVSTCLLGIALFGVSVSVAAAAETPEAADLCKDAVDPYTPGTERVKFFQAAGVDSELDAKEFEAARTGPNGFVRKFDQWKAIVAFDKGGNQTIDWFEADAYRRDLRTRVMAAFDSNKDGRLAGEERDAANKALAAGNVPKAVATPTTRPADGKIVILTPTPRPGTDATTPAGGQGDSRYYRPDYNALRKKFDSDGDGRLTREERAALSAAVNAERTKWQLSRYDKNGDGKLDEDERKAMNEDRVAYAQRLREQRLFRQFDKNQDGTLDETERAEKEKWEESTRRRREEMQRRVAAWRTDYQELVKKHDANGDGRITGDEMRPFRDALRQRAELRRWDGNQDGQLDETERAAMEKQRAERAQRREERQKQYVERWDTDKDGKVSEEERNAMQAELRRRREEARKEMDADADGNVTREERREYQRKQREKYDTNKDGQLDAEERRKMNEETSGWRRGGRRGGGRGDPGRMRGNRTRVE